jgi:acylphosphatase
MAEVRCRAIVRGLVQGVGFRMNTRAEALRLGISGSARNLADGSVEVVAQGDRESVDELIGWLRTGPRFATVHSVEHTDIDVVEGFGGFEVS